MLTLEFWYLTGSDRSSGTWNEAYSLKIEQDNKEWLSLNESNTHLEHSAVL